MPYGYSRREVLLGIAGTASAAALPVGAPAGDGPATAADVTAAADPAAAADHGSVDSERTWARFLADQDPVWARLPRTWYEGPFLGNGFLGSILYAEPAANALRLTVQHSEVQDHRPEIQGNDWGVARLPVGHLTLEPLGRITDVELRLHLWDAEVTGTVTTDRGRIELRALVQNDRSLLLVTTRASGGERGFRWVFHPEKAISPRIVREPPPPALTPNPDPVSGTVGGVALVVQPMVAGGQTATAYREVTREGTGTLYLTVAHTYPETLARQRVLDTVQGAVEAGVEHLVQRHRDWWHRYYRRSFLSIPDQMLQSFYWIQLYKVASAARAEAPVMATTGPWLEPTPWPGVWWNLNVQLEYWLVHGSNHLELDAIPRTLIENQQILVDGLRPEYRADSAGLRRSTDQHGNDNGFVAVPGQNPPAPEIGDLPWALHNVWLSYRHTMDVRILRDVLFPLLRRAMNYYLHFLYPGTDGRLHLPPTFSPEYGVDAPDTNYDLALIRWSCQTLLESAQLLGIEDPLADQWRLLLAKLADYPVDANGFMIGAGVPFTKSHRHYSHLLMVYPLYLVNAEQPEHRALIETSLQHWISFAGALRGYSFTGAASISAQLGKGDDALGYLRELCARFIQPNTMYYEAGPVIETPLSAAQSLHDMVCQSWGGVIRVFPAVPAAWRDAALDDFRTQGAFLVSAVRRAGVTAFVRVHSLAGAPCVVRTGIDGPLTVRAPHGPDPAWRQRPNGDLEIDLPKGAEVAVYRAGDRPDLTVRPVPVSTPAPRWGLPPLPAGGTVVPVDLTAAFNNDGTSNEFSMRDGDFDGTGRTYPATQLPQTGHLTADGIELLVAGGAEGTNNNIVPSGQTVPMPSGRYASLHVLGAADTGNASVTATLTYADGSTAAVPLQLTGWLADPNYGETVALRTTQVYSPGGALDLQAGLFHQKLPVDPARDLTALVLPPAGTGPRPHIFALSLEHPR
jgi:hypothetical protein